MPLVQQAMHQGVSLVIAPLLADVAAGLRATQGWGTQVIDTAVEATPGETRRQILSGLQVATYSRRSPRASSRPIEYNFARNFPLNNPFLTRYYHVDRSSVRELLRTFERRNGARVWCSVRRSGKTTACNDLGATGQAAVVVQTCDTTGLSPGSSVFYEEVVRALETRAQVGKTFFKDAVALAGLSSSQASDGQRVVFVLDEYETLFGRLAASGRPDNELRYTVVQPLLNQMAEFARDNLLVLLGQQPNAHYILMDQNQLSPQVQQDSFPLFRFASGSGRTEFGELISRVLTTKIGVDPGFVEEVFGETAGHPFLTVNLLVGVVDWLIEQRRRVGGLTLTGADFEEFASAHLSPGRVKLSPEYAFFHAAAAAAIRRTGAQDMPWLHAIYRALRQIGQASDGMTCTRDDFERIVMGDPEDEQEWDAADLLASGSQANFLAFDGETVRPRIRLLARIAAVAAAGRR